MELYKVARIPPVIADGDMSVTETAQLMAQQQAHAVLIVDERMRVQGIFTERDLVNRVVARRLNPDRTQLKDVMTEAVETVPAETSVDEALDMMVRKHYRHLPIVDAQECVIGIASMAQLLMRQNAAHKADVETLAAYVTAGGPG
ncbi:MAG TPA: CBS domain-containing protein [Planctomycetota bacterium]|nr:CBS domain-containing protein [Planctomycetota bacterium]